MESRSSSEDGSQILYFISCLCLYSLCPSRVFLSLSFLFFCPVNACFISGSYGFGWVSPKSLVFRSVYQLFGNGEALFEQIFPLSIPTGLPITKSARVVHTFFEDYMVVCGYVRYRLRGYHS